ncbi:MAG: winged helix-turn-helix domain-containing protein [Maricaulaceae bacterium]|jgi:DNA-binding transcriptional ArsR family regulator
MKEGPDISHVAALIGDPARANMLAALLDGRALTASELAACAGITKQTASSHLAKLRAGALVAQEVQGRHRYFRLHDADVGDALEALMGVAAKRSGMRTRTGPKDPALRKARVCYDHLAGELAVHMFDRMTARGWIKSANGSVELTRAGERALSTFGLNLAPLAAARRPMCRPCLDWSMRRHHLAGGLGGALLDAFFARKWARRGEGRIIAFSPKGEEAFRSWLG